MVDEQMLPGDVLTADDIAVMLGTTVQTVRRYFALPAGDPRRLPGRKVGRGWKTTRAELIRWLADG